MTTMSRPTRAERRDAAREKARQLRLAAEARRRRQRRVLLLAAVAGVLAVVVGVGALVQAERSAVSTSSSEPANFSDGGFLTGDSAAPVVTVYYDYLCPACRQFEESVGPWLAQQRDSGAIALEYKPISILDRASTTEYSTRAANAAACVADSAPQAFVGFHDAMFAAQPLEGGPGLSDDEIVRIARDSGAGEQAAQCITEGSFAGWVANVTDASSKAGVPGTPSVMVNGRFVEDRSVQGIQAAVEAARG